MKAEGIVIRATDYGEGNKIITVLTKEAGKVSLMARGAKKPKSRLSSVTQLFSYAHLLFFKAPGGMGTLSQGELIRSYRKVREDLKKTAYAAYFVEWVDKIIEDGERNPLILNQLVLVLNYLEEDKDGEILARIFELKLLIQGGYQPQLQACVQCGASTGQIAFSIKEGGVLCPECQHRDPDRLLLQPATIRLLQLFYRLDLERVGNIQVKPATKEELRKVIWMFMDHHTPLRLKSRSFLEQMKDFWEES